MEKVDFHAITLIEKKRINGAWVRIPSPDPADPVGTVTSEFFGYESYGGSEPAIEAAKAWRDKTGPMIWGDRWPQAVMTTFKPRIRLSSANTSDEIGVSLVTHCKHGKECQYWLGQWQSGPEDDRKTAKKQFSVNRYQLRRKTRSVHGRDIRRRDVSPVAVQYVA